MTDYTLKALDFQLESTRQLQSILFNQMERESDFILSCLESMSIVMEAETTNDNDKRNFFEKIIDFIKKIFGVFTEKTKTLFKNNKEWLDDNIPKLDHMDYSGLEIELLPYWVMNTSKMESAAKQILDKMNKEMRNVNPERHKDMENVKNDIFAQYLDEEDSLAGGFKNFFRVGKAKGPIKPVTIKDNELKSKAKSEFANYCRKYDTAISPTVQRLLNQAQTNFKMASDMLNKKEAMKENFCLIEGAFYSETDLAYCENFVVLEADQNEKKEEKKPEKPVDDKDRSPTKVNVTDHGSKQNAQTHDKLNALSTEQLSVAKNIAQVAQMAIAAYMTVAEERFHVYLSALKQIISARGPKGEKK